VASAFPTLVAHYQDLVYGIARRSTNDATEAEDLAQEAFLRAFRALGRYDAARIADLRLRGWLASITLNAARNRARDRDPDTATIEAIPEPVDGGDARPDAIAERREEAWMWRRRLDALPRGYRQAVELRHVEGLSYPELAAALRKPIGTVKSDVHRGVALLRRAYVAEMATETDRAVEVDGLAGAADTMTRGATGATGRTGSGGKPRAGDRREPGLPTPEVMIG
jgi:RNA polymerase sigma-70 factor (ECF subfamily)